MPRLSNRVKNAVRSSAGSVFTIKKTITSSNITTTAQALTSTATGELEVLQIIAKTDATGLAGGTNFVIASDNAKGVVNIFVETIANMGANATKVLSGVATAADTTTSDGTPSVTSLATVLEAGKKITFNNTSSVGTGAGTVDVYVTFRRLADNAGCVAA